MTAPQRKLLVSLLKNDGRHLRGAEVRVARNLEALGLVVLEDNGSLQLGGREDGERWSASITDKGREQANKDGT